MFAKKKIFLTTTKDSNDNDNSINSGSNNNNNISIENLSLPKLNYSCLLNNPLSSSHSYIDDLKNIFNTKKYSSKYKDANRRLQTEERLKKENKFTILDITTTTTSSSFDTADVRSNTSQTSSTLNDSCPNRTRAQLQMKPLLKLNFDDYINTIKHSYVTYKRNHITPKQTTTTDVPNLNNFTYTSTISNALQQVDNDFQIDNSIFKINSDLLGNDLPTLQSKIFTFIEQSGVVDMEMQKLNGMNVMLYNNLIQSLPELKMKVHEVYEGIFNMKQKVNEIKHKFVFANAKVVLLKQKQRQMKLIVNELYKLRNIKMIIDNKQTDNVSIGMDVIKSLERFPLVQEIKVRFSNIITANYDKTLNEIEYLFRKKLLECIYQVDNINEQTLQGSPYTIKKELFDQIVSYSNSNSNTSNDVANNGINVFLKCDNDISFESLLTIINKLTSMNYTNTIQSRLEKTILNCINDFYITLCSQFQITKPLNEILFIFHLTQITQTLYDIITTKLSSLSKHLSQSFHTTFISNISSYLHQNITSLFTTNQNVSSLTLDMFIHKNHLLKQIFDTFPYITTKHNSNYASDIENTEIAFISKYYKSKYTKISEGIKFDTFTPFKDIPSTYQFYVNKICEFDITQVGTYENTKQYFNINNKGINTDKNIEYIIIPDNNSNNSSKVYLILTTLEIISYTYDTIKMLCSFSIKNYTSIINNMFTLYKTYINLNKDIILEDNGQIECVTQNEIVITYTNITLLEYLINTIYTNDKSTLLNTFTNGQFVNGYQRLLEIFESFSRSCEEKIDDLIKGGCVLPFIKVLKEIDFNNYPSVDDTHNQQVNEYIRTLIRVFKSMYISIEKGFKMEFVVGVFTKNLELLCEEMENAFKDVECVGDDKGKKQLKKDLFFVKKYLGSGNIDTVVDMKEVRKNLFEISPILFLTPFISTTVSIFPLPKYFLTKSKSFFNCFFPLSSPTHSTSLNAFSISSQSNSKFLLNTPTTNSILNPFSIETYIDLNTLISVLIYSLTC